MTKKDDTIYLRHILDAIQRIEEYLAGVSYDRFLQSSLLQDGVVRQLEIIGEAATKVSIDFRDAHPGLAWGSMIGMRNRLIHAYFKVDLSIVWDTVQNDLPSLKQQVERILGAST
jgi:uncharacterized protein with HEPN domain